MPLPPRLPAPSCLPAVALALALAATLAAAEKADRNKPLNIEADAGRYDDLKQVGTFSGNVVVTKGTLTMRAANIEVRQSPDGYQHGVATALPGQLATFSQKRDGVDETIQGEAERIEYDGKADTVRFVRRAEMRRLAGATLQDQVLGSVIVYNNTTEVYTVDGAPRSDGAPSAAPGGRVRATLAPRTPSSGPAPASAPVVPLRPATRLPAGAGG